MHVAVVVVLMQYTSFHKHVAGIYLFRPSVELLVLGHVYLEEHH